MTSFEEEYDTDNDVEVPVTVADARGDDICFEEEYDTDNDVEVPVTVADARGDDIIQKRNDGMKVENSTTGTTTTEYYNNKESSMDNTTIFPLWSEFTKTLHETICRVLVFISVTAARYPLVTLSVIPIGSFLLLAAGYFTNFELVVDVFEAFAPINSNAVLHKAWIDNAGFDDGRNPFLMMIHSDGDNIVGKEAIKRVITAIDVVRDTPGFYDICLGDHYLDLDTCEILSVGGFWGHNLTTFENEVESDEDVAKSLKGVSFSDGFPVDLINYVDTISVDEAKGSDTLDSAKAYFIYILLRQTNITLDFESVALRNIKNLRDDWLNEEGNPFQLEVSSVFVSPVEEMNQAILNDLPLIPVVIFVMSAFTCMVFFRMDVVKSRTVLGFGSVITIGLSLATGFGFMFLIGVPYTNMTTLLPFIVFGVGLDDTFIITGHYFRTDSRRDPLERLAETISIVGMSIFVTTLTTSLAFFLGLITNIPAIRWLCLYAFPTIIIDFIYQITFFAAILILDERRIQANRMDVLICCNASYRYDTNSQAGSNNNNSGTRNRDTYKSIPDRFMAWYADILMKPWAKITVILAFTALFAGCIFSTTQLYQSFDATELVPEESYLRMFVVTWKEYMLRSFPVSAYFRDVDQSDPKVQEQMLEYIDDMVALPNFGREPEFCWVKDWPELTKLVSDDLSFNEKLDRLLQYPHLMKIYGRSIVRDEDSGNITASYCQIHTYGVDADNIKQQIAFLHEQRAMTAEQPIDEGVNPPDWPFFSYDVVFIMLEFYAVHVNELITTTIAGLVAITAVTLFFLPHWSAVVFVLPIMVILYIDLIGSIQMAGLYMNVVTFVILVVSIGLLVDFVLHVLLCYYESTAPTREEKAKDSLRTLGSSILVGGISTFLGVVPLAFSTSTVIQTVYICFFIMIALGVSHGLILLPVLLSIFGPEHNDNNLFPGLTEDISEELDESDDGGNTKTDDYDKNSRGNEICGVIFTVTIILTATLTAMAILVAILLLILL